MKKVILTVLLALSLAGCSSIMNAGSSSSAFQTVSSEEAQKMMETEKDYIILDVRTTQEYADGHIPDAINLSNEDIQAGKIDSLENKDQMILLYCRSGNRSRQAAQKLVELGFKNVIDFGGINSWQGDIIK